MILRRLGVQNFRNIAAAGVDFQPGNTFLLGPNGQGKSNLIEAIGFMTALRAFRTHEQKALIRHGAEEAALAYVVEKGTRGRTELTIRLRAQGRSVELDGEPVRRFAEVIGQFPTVVFASEDIQLIRGGPAIRRRLIDLFLSSLDSGYLRALTRYHRSLRERNALLRQEAGDGQLAAFEQVMAPLAAEISQSRAAVAVSLEEALGRFYLGLCGGAEDPRFQFRPDVRADGEDAWLRIFRDGRPRDRQMKSSQKGPQRDDFRLLINGREAQDYASEGQQRGLVLALRFAQIQVIRDRTGAIPIVLADDVLGELDPVRRERFWRHLDPDTQVIASGTTPPDAKDPRSWRILEVEGGRFAFALTPGIQFAKTATMIPLEDYSGDIIGKVMRGRGISEDRLCRDAGISDDELSSLLQGEPLEAALRKVAAVLDLGADQLVVCAKKTWYPVQPEKPAGFASANTTFHDMTVNAYVAWDSETREAVVFDSGADSEPLIEIVRKNHLAVKLILLTHSHTDHVIDLPKLVEAVGNPPVWINARETGDEDFPGNARTFETGKTFSVGRLSIESVLTDGHSPGGTTFLVKGLKQPLAIVGDSLFAGSMGGSLTAYETGRQNNLGKILTLPEATILAPGHGPLTTVGQERTHNPFFAGKI